MENSNGIFNRVIVNNDPYFKENSNCQLKATYVILCEEDSENTGKQIYEYPICGLSLAEWVAMACETKPVYISVGKNENFLSLVKPYIGASEYTIVLYANTPLVSKTHLKDLLEYVSMKNLNVCKLKKGYILKNEYIREVDEIYSSLVYDLSSNDFLEVNNYYDVDKVRGTLERRMFNYHKRNGVVFYNQNTTVIDANVKIGRNVKIYGGVSIISGSIIAENVTLNSNVTVSNSKIGENSEIGINSVVCNSIVKDNAKIESFSNIDHSVIDENAIIGSNVVVSESFVSFGSKIDNFSKIQSASIMENVTVRKSVEIVGDGVTVVIEPNSEVKLGTKILKDSQN